MDCKERILSDKYVEFVVDFPVEIARPQDNDICYISLGEGYAVFYENLLLANSRWGGPYHYRYTPKLYGLMDLQSPQSGAAKGKDRMAGEMTAAQLSQEPFDPSALIASGILGVQREPLNLTGRGCIICFIDTGVDYTNPVFRREDGSSRILAIWDQTIQEGTPPEEPPEEEPPEEAPPATTPRPGMKWPVFVSPPLSSLNEVSLHLPPKSSKEIPSP